MRGIGRVVAMDFAGTHYSHRWLHFFHRANLDGRRMRSQQQTVALRLRLLSGNEECVLCIASGMVRRKIQGFEIVVVGLDLWTFFNGVTKIAEDADDLVHRLDDGMLYSQRTANAGKGDVDAFLTSPMSMGLAPTNHRIV